MSRHDPEDPAPPADGIPHEPNDRPPPNDEHAWIDPFAERLDAAARELVEAGEASRVSERAIQQIMTAALRLYVARTDGEERTFRPLTGTYDEDITATEVISATSELLRALHLGPMELSIWYRQRPDPQE
jgi:hypothetical protein